LKGIYTFWEDSRQLLARKRLKRGNPIMKGFGCWVLRREDISDIEEGIQPDRAKKRTL